jgi:hypothetical protein
MQYIRLCLDGVHRRASHAGLEARRPRRYTDEPDENLYSEYHLSRVYYLLTSLLSIMNRNVVMGRWCRYLVT